MKNSIKKIISVVICAVMLLAVGAIASSAATYDNPVFKVVLVSETSTEVTVSLDLVSGQLNSCGFQFVPKSGYVCKSITPSGSFSGGILVPNVANGKVEGVVAVTGSYSKTGTFCKATFTKPAGAKYVSGDIKVVFDNCVVSDKDYNSIELYPVVQYDFAVELNTTDIAMNYKDSAKLECTTALPKGCVAIWSSSDTGVVTVSETGDIYAAGKGDATVTCSVYDANGTLLSEAACDVSVSYTFGQWLIIILLLGFIWYI